MSGPLEGCLVIEMAGIGPAPFAGMLLAEMGAEVIRIDRPGGDMFFAGMEEKDGLNRGKKSVLLDLKKTGAVEAVLELVARADILIEGYRPGVAERLGLGPDVCLQVNPRLVYGRMTGWGQDGPLSQSAGHDINYVSVTGALHAIGSAGGPPEIPLNLVGDFGGGAMYLVSGVLAALHRATLDGTGQVVDAAIVDGAAHLLSGVHALMGAGRWVDERGQNMLDGGTPFYGIYATSDNRHMAVGALEPKFFKALVSILCLPDDVQQHDRAQWPKLKAQIAAAFAKRTQTEWTETFAGSDACVSPVVTLREAVAHPHMAARDSLGEIDGIVQAGLAPRFSSTPTYIQSRPPLPGEHTREVFDAQLVSDADGLLASGAAFQRASQP